MGAGCGLRGCRQGRGGLSALRFLDGLQRERRGWRRAGVLGRSRTLAGRPRLTRFARFAALTRLTSFTRLASFTRPTALLAFARLAWCARGTWLARRACRRGVGGVSHHAHHIGHARRVLTFRTIGMRDGALATAVIPLSAATATAATAPSTFLAIDKGLHGRICT